MRPRLSCLLVVIANSITTLASSDYGVPVEIQLWDTGRTPLAHMVDVTNEFGLKVMAEHNFLNDNNIAFSPYGLMGILVALYEGLDGDSSYQIQRAMQLPWNRNVMRVGFRDIHRTLKTYFVPEEGFLAGLALNNENVTFSENYKKILRFYGFDLENDHPQSSSNVTSSPPTTNETTTSDSSTTPATTREETSTAPSREETTPRPSTETSTDIDVRIPSTAPASSAPNAESTPQSTEEQTTATTQSMTTQTSQATDTTTAASSTATETETTQAQTTPSVSEPAITTNNDVEILSTLIPTTNISTQSTAEMVATTVSADTSDSPDTTPTSETTTIGTESTLETLERKKKSIVDFVFTNPPYIQDLANYRSYDIGPELETEFSDKTFLANGLRNVQVTYMQYDTTLDHAYLPHLEASALRLPLDSSRYYLLAVLPDRPGPAMLSRLVARLARGSDLRDVHAALRPTRVRALVPSFTVKGHVSLTTDLQKLGIRDVFEPRQRDFTPMTPQPGVYVRSVEQAVSVAIRKYQPDDPKTNRYVKNRYPVHFTATYPFLYFVMDSNIHVALMAGKMVDPLNTRIL